MHKILLWIKFSLLAAILVLSIVLSFTHNWGYIHEYINSFGFYVPLLVFLFTVAITTLGLPIMIPIFLAAFSLNYVTAVIVILLGATIGSAGGFYIARFLGREYLEQMLIFHSRRLKRLNKNLEKNGFWATLILRLIPILPFEVVSIIGGVSRMHLKHYLAATFLGIIPGTSLLLYLLRSFGTNYFYAAAFLMFAIFSIPLLSKNVRGIVFG